MTTSSDLIIQKLPREYVESRGIEKVRGTWIPLIDEEMSRHWDLIKEGIKGFSLAHAGMLSALTRFERDETAELIIRQFVDDRFPGALDLISQIEPLVNQYPSHVVEEAVMVCDDHDIRSVTMDVEPGPSNYHRGESSMPPPPRPAAPLTPVTPAGPKGIRHQNDHEQPPVGDVSSDTDHGSLALLQTAKRSLDVVEVDNPRTPESPTKKAKSTTAPHSTGKVTKSVDFWEVEGQQYIFKDNQCGPGWFVVRCGPGQRVPFLKHPLKGNIATDHFNDDDQPCHDSRRIYTFDDVLREYTYRVNDLSGDMTEQRIESANERLQREHGAHRGSAKKPRKGKERAGPARSTATNARLVTSDTDGSYQDEMIQEVIAEFLAEV
ncbi:hypothetical protein LA080_007617 [Diaporthe eres]|nr:hypothetical protein LA080_007617 [Diaporthe eres]